MKLHDLLGSAYFYRTKDPRMGVAKRPYLHFQRSPNDHALSTFGSTDKRGHR